jgi:hypothetical protein
MKRDQWENYYEVRQVSENAEPEVSDAAYVRVYVDDIRWE